MHHFQRIALGLFDSMGEMYREYDVEQDPSKWYSDIPENCKYGIKFTSHISQVAVRREHEAHHIEAAEVAIRLSRTFEWHDATALQIHIFTNRGQGRPEKQVFNVHKSAMDNQQRFSFELTEDGLPLRKASATSSMEWKEHPHSADPGSVTVFIRRGQPTPDQLQSLGSRQRACSTWWPRVDLAEHPVALRFERLPGQHGNWLGFEFQVRPKGHIFPGEKPIVPGEVIVIDEPDTAAPKSRKSSEPGSAARAALSARAPTSNTIASSLAHATQHSELVVTAGMGSAPQHRSIDSNTRFSAPRSTALAFMSPTNLQQQIGPPNENESRTVVKDIASGRILGASRATGSTSQYKLATPLADNAALLKRTAPTAGSSSTASNVLPAESSQPMERAGIFSDTIGGLLRKRTASMAGLPTSAQLVRIEESIQPAEKNVPVPDEVDPGLHEAKASIIDPRSMEPQSHAEKLLERVEVTPSIPETTNALQEPSQVKPDTTIKREHSPCSRTLEVLQPVADSIAKPAQSFKKAAKSAVVDLTEDDDDLVEVKKEYMSANQPVTKVPEPQYDDDEDEEDLELELREIRAERKLRALRKAKQARRQGGGR